jgi:hypothetical protein
MITKIENSHDMTKIMSVSSYRKGSVLNILCNNLKLLLLLCPLVLPSLSSARLPFSKPHLAAVSQFDDQLSAADLLPRQISSRINCNFVILTPEEGKLDFTAEQRDKVNAAMQIVDTVVNSQIFWDRLNELSTGQKVFRVGRKVRQMELYFRDPFVKKDSSSSSVQPLDIMRYLEASEENGKPFNVTIYDDVSPKSSEIAVTKGDTLRFNAWNFAHQTVTDIAGTLLHERLHYYGFKHQYYSTFGLRKKKVPYYFGDLISHLLSGISAAKAPGIFGVTLPASAKWK